MAQLNIYCLDVLKLLPVTNSDLPERRKEVLFIFIPPMRTLSSPINTAV